MNDEPRSLARIGGGETGFEGVAHRRGESGPDHEGDGVDGARRRRVPSPGERGAQLSHDGITALGRIDVELDPGDPPLGSGSRYVRSAVYESKHESSQHCVVAVVLERGVERRANCRELQPVDGVWVGGGGILGTGECRRGGGEQDRRQTFHGTLRVLPQYRCYWVPPEGAAAARTTIGYGRRASRG